MPPKGWGPTPPDKKNGKFRNGMYIGPKSNPVVDARQALKDGLVKKLKKPITPIECASTPVDRNGKGKRVPGSRQSRECGACHATGVGTYNVVTKKTKDCKDCHGVGYL